MNRPALLAPALLAPALLALAGCSAADAPADPQPSVAVSTARVVRGALPETVIAYGTASPSPAGVETLGFAQPGQITAVMVSAGLPVRKGQPLLTFAPAASVRASYAQAQNALHAAQVQESATRQLLARQLATTDQLAQAERALADARASLQGLAADSAGSASTTLTAPFDGVVATLGIARGERSPAGAPLLTLARADALIVSAGLDPADSAHVSAGQGVQLQRLSGGTQVAGHVLRVAGALDPKTRLVPVEIAFPAGALMPGEAVRAQIATRPVAGWLVPHRAVVTADGPPHVFEDRAGKASAVPVAILLATDSGDVVDGALDPARPVITDGAYQLRDGDRLRRGQ
ncbi:MAG TPA: efflux RND transporter periplasmic adaptor subunit [Novosphingobium sp.]|nr:efflux RND transporter periplasmic adaptor subunit [Novosphingobium sp.]